MPRDPVVLFNQRQQAMARQDAEFRKQAATIVARQFPDFVAGATDEQISARVDQVQGLLRQQAEYPLEVTQREITLKTIQPPPQNLEVSRIHLPQLL